MKTNQFKALFLAVCMLAAALLVPAGAFCENPKSIAALANDGGSAITKITNPEAGEGMPDGINTNDITGYEANRYNSYAWAVAARDGYLYIGTNRNMYGGGIMSIAFQMAQAQGVDFPEMLDKIMNLVTLFSGDDFPDPREMSEDDWIPQIIKLNPVTGTTEVIYQPDLTGFIPSSEGAAFRSVTSLNGNLYFGSFGKQHTQLIRIDENDNCTVVYEAGISNITGRMSSLRANCVYNGTIVIGGNDSSISVPDEQTLPVVIRMMNPGDDTDWTKIIADYRDFGKYADAAGGNILDLWDLVEYNGTLYVTLAADKGFTLYRGEEASSEQADEANEYGWIWTPIIGAGGRYNSGMAETPEGTCVGVAPGLLDVTGTPFVYNGKLYIGTFDNGPLTIIGTAVQLIQRINNPKDGPSLSQIYKMLYNATMHPQSMYVMDENENVSKAEGLTELIAGTNNDYIWRMTEYSGKLYTSTFDPSTIYAYFTVLERIMDVIGFNNPNYIETEYLAKLKANEGFIKQIGVNEPNAAKLLILNEKLYNAFLACANNEIGLEELYNEITAVNTALSALELNAKYRKAAETIRGIFDDPDIVGIGMIIELAARYAQADKGFDLYATEDGENWETVLVNGFNDKFNYGGRTLTVCSNKLYIGTANPFYGAQVWEYDSGEEEPPLIINPGDYDCDGDVDVQDALLTLRAAMGLIEPTEQSLLNADMDGDGILTTADALTILRMAMGLI